MGKKVLKDYDWVSLKEENLSGEVDFGEIFGRNSPVHIEIGSGKGTFLVSQGRHEPGVNFLGTEWANKYYRYAVDRVGRWDLRNVRIIRTDAADFLAEHVGDGTVSFFHVYFPDPWPKKRHHKRRFICDRNIEQMLRCLEAGGIVNIATDYKDYFEQIQEVVYKQVQSGRAELIEFIATVGAEDEEVAGTNYERKYIRDGRKIYTLALKKTYG
jgi:tRNA (guanine-N7-)-methyltransferase